MLRLIYAFVCEEVIHHKETEGNFDLTAVKILDKRILNQVPTKLEKDIRFVVGVSGEEEDDGEELSIRVRGKELEFKVDPFNYPFKEYDSISVYHVGFSEFPVTVEGTVYFEVVHKNKILSRYPVKFLLKEEM
ncbi:MULTISPECIES: acetyl-CoA acetyltransferase [unclassified Paenibacillus]|uniref:acetyl-CoA acetyltransferase n=1 Tax=unclassified Paenibacillus TaxID=185978 RepID=UPI0024755D78|nr:MULTISPECIES: acetyl-CoA acetyltransferase [unclassified Paenibacillus]MDH6427292.1 hypothetical protein [Paenibacillus sp. PastH-4]MDH6443322.1 hypothetical protein [Paenibacillus sp. PastF-4]MDH6525974.1 hypothetical protein [Paenibacillus sp. PastH-3]